MTRYADVGVHRTFVASAASVDGRSWLMLSGPGESRNVAQLRSAIATLGLKPGQLLELSVAALESCDNDVAWELLELVRDVRDIGGRVRVTEPPNPLVAAVLTLADVRGDLAVDAATDPDGSHLPWTLLVSEPSQA